MRYFELYPDMRVPGRWHLGDVFRNGVDQKQAFDSHRLLNPDPVDIEVTHPGRGLDYSVTAFDVPVATHKLALAMGVVAGSDIQLIPAKVGGTWGYEVVNCTRLVDCLDEHHSEFEKWTVNDHRPDRVGRYRWVYGLKLDPTRIPSGAHCFRVAGWTVALVVSQELRSVMEHVGCIGADFVNVCG